MPDFMDWQPATPQYSQWHDPYSDPYYMPGGWPMSPPKRRISSERKRSAQFEEDGVTPVTKRVRGNDWPNDAISRSWQEMKARWLAKPRPPVFPIADFGRTNNTARRIGPATRLQQRVQTANATDFPAQQTSLVGVLSQPLPEQFAPSTLMKGVITSILRQEPEVTKATEAADTTKAGEAVVAPQIAKITSEEATPLAAEQEQTTDNQAAPMGGLTSVFAPAVVAPEVKREKKKSKPAPRIDPVMRRRNAKWGMFAYASTAQVGRLTPEPEVKTEQASEEAEEEQNVPDIFNNMPILRPMTRHMITPEPKEVFTPPWTVTPVAPVAPLEQRSQSTEPSDDDDAVAAQLFNELQASIEITDPDISEIGSEDLNTAWFPVPSTSSAQQAITPAMSANSIVAPPLTEPMKLVEPSAETRSITDSVMGTPLQSGTISKPYTPSLAQLKSLESDISSTANMPAADHAAMVEAWETRQAVPAADTLTSPPAIRNNAYTSDPLTPAAAQGKLAELLSSTTINPPSEQSPKKDTPKAIHHSAERLRRLTRQQKLKAEALKEALNQYEIAPLTPEWDEKVRVAVRQGSGKYSASDLARVVPQYASRGQDNWLNDEAINGYLALVTAHGKKTDRDTQTPSYHAFNSFFYTNISTKGPDSVARWSKRAKIAGKSLLDVKKVFIPINSGAHWTLAVVDPQAKKITHYNSMRSATLGATACNHIKKWVAMELKSDFKPEEWTIENVGESPQQTNCDDCGVFTITSARQIMLGYTPMSYKSDQIQTQRKRIVAELVHGSLIKSKEDTKE